MTPTSPRRRPPASKDKKQGGCGLVVKVTGIIGLCFIGFIGYHAFTLFKELESTPRLFKPGQEAYELAEKSVIRYDKTATFGNTDKARIFAAKFSEQMKILRQGLFTKGKKSDFSLTDGEFLTHCNLIEGKCAFLVHVPQLRKFTPRAQEQLVELAWLSANAILKDAEYEQSTELAVGVKGIMNYAGIYIGKLDQGNAAMGGVAKKGKGFLDGKMFYPFFEEEPTGSLTKSLSSKQPETTRSTPTENPFRERIIQKEYYIKSKANGEYVKQSRYQADKTKYPTVGIRFTSVPEGSATDTAGIKKDSIMFLRDGRKFWGKYVPMILMNQPYVAHLIDSDDNEQRVKMEPGSFEAPYAHIYRIDLAYLRNEVGLRSPKWDRHLIIAGLFILSNPPLAETALHHAIEAGYRQDALTDFYQIQFKAVSKEGAEKEMESFFDRFDGVEIPWVYLPHLHNALVTTGRIDFMKQIADQAGDNCVFDISVVNQFLQWTNGETKFPDKSLLDRANENRGDLITNISRSARIKGKQKSKAFKLNEPVEISASPEFTDHSEYSVSKIPHNFHYHIESKIRLNGIVDNDRPIARLYFTNEINGKKENPSMKRFLRRTIPFSRQSLHLAFSSNFSYTVIEASGNKLPGLLLDRQKLITIPFVENPLLPETLQKEFETRQGSLVGPPLSIEIDLIRYRNEVGIFVDSICYLHLPANPIPSQDTNYNTLVWDFLGMDVSIENQAIWKLKD